MANKNRTGDARPSGGSEDLAAKPGSGRFVATSFRILCVTQAMLLFVASGAKLWMLLTNPFADVHSGFPLPILWMAVVVEFASAWYLVRRKPPGLQWLLMVSLFSVFLIITTARFYLGYQSCGCMGNLAVPSWALPLNSFCMVAFLMFVWAKDRSCFRLADESMRFVSSLKDPLVAGRILGIGILVAGLVASSFSIQFWGSYFGFAQIPSTGISVGRPKTGELMELTVSVENNSLYNATIVGAGTSCNCVSVSGKRQTIPATGEVELKVIVRPSKLGPFRQRVVCYLDHPDQDRFTIDVYGHVY